MKTNKLAELNEIVTELEDEGFFREAQILHDEFIKISQVTLDQPKNTFQDMLREYAPSFLKLCRPFSLITWDELPTQLGNTYKILGRIIDPGV